MTARNATFGLAACDAELRGFAVHRLDFDRHTRGPCVHECATLVVVDEGEGRWFANAEEQALRAGEVSLLSQGERHVYSEVDEVRGWVVHFAPAALAPATDHASTEGLLPSDAGRGALFSPIDRLRRGFPRSVSLGVHQARVHRRLEAIDRELTERAWCFEEAARAELALLLIDLGRVLVPSDRLQIPSQTGRVGAALAVIQERYRDGLSLEDVARELRCSPAHLTTAVRVATGMTVVQWILAFRMNEARRRLDASDERVEIVAERVGFQSPEHFARLFKREHGVSPGRWRLARKQGAAAPSL